VHGSSRRADGSSAEEYAHCGQLDRGLEFARCRESDCHLHYGCLYEDVTFGAVNHGSAELRKFAVSIFEAVSDAKFELVDSSVDRGHRSIEWIFSGTDHGLYKTGKRFFVRGVSVIDLRQGRISRNLDYYDAASIMRQVGLLPSEKTDSTK